MTRGVAVVPESRPEMHQALTAAVQTGGAEIVPLNQAEAVVWADPAAVGVFRALIDEATAASWIQLPYAGIESLIDLLDNDHTWTCGKGVYADACAEWMIAGLLAAFRDIPRFARATSWPRQGGRNLLGAKITLLGGGGLAESFLRLIEPWQCDVTVVRRTGEPLPGATRTVTTDQRFAAVRDADAVIVCLALTPETDGIVDQMLFDAMPDDCWLLNVGRGSHVRNDDLLAALDAEAIAGAVLDVTDPEPLPDSHPLWAYDNVLITPHVGNTPEMGLPLLAARVEENVRRWLRGDKLLGGVDVDAGY
ncbi:MAG: phosphoglycerate dehydrogenase-like enzyme [Candidatus Aldehydirespiratoraceae bacterium]|jgi:phosphoglycerate dehydrogenase-like enzyme